MSVEQLRIWSLGHDNTSTVKQNIIGESNLILIKNGSQNTYDLLKSFFEAILSIFRNTILGSYWVVQMQPGLNGYRSRLQFSLTDAKDLDLGCQQCMEFMLIPSGRITIGPYHSAVD